MLTSRQFLFALGGGTAALLGAAAVALAQTTTVVTHPNSAGGQTSVIHVMVNQQPVTFSGPGPVMIDGAVMVPVRGVFEDMGGQVQWMPQAKVVEGARPGHMFRIRVGSDQALVDGVQRSLSTPPQVIDGTTYIPLRFASEALGAHVAWQGSDRTVVITTNPGGTVVTTAPTAPVVVAPPPAPAAPVVVTPGTSVTTTSPNGAVTTTTPAAP